jgi:uncharacterized membrane-anchored protein
VTSTERTSTERRFLTAKVPQITAVFWAIKLLTTGIGESTSDFLGKRSIALAGLIGVVGFVVALGLQMRSRRYSAPLYWFAVLMVAVSGTMAADVLHRFLGVPYIASTAFYAVVLAVVFVVWHRVEGTLSIHSIVTPRREAFYWLTVLATFALGTAAGDLTALTLGLGFFGSIVLFAVLIMVPFAAWRLGAGAVATFWAAYVLTRPLGASVADWLGKPHRLTGLDYGDGTVAGIGLVVFVVAVAAVTLTRHGEQRARTAAPSSAQSAQDGGFVGAAEG